MIHDIINDLSKFTVGIKSDTNYMARPMFQ